MEAGNNCKSSHRVRLELGQEFEIAAAVGNGREAIQAVLRYDPDALVTDISMPVMNLLQAPSLLMANHGPGADSTSFQS